MVAQESGGSGVIPLLQKRDDLQVFSVAIQADGINRYTVLDQAAESVHMADRIKEIGIPRTGDNLFMKTNAGFEHSKGHPLVNGAG